MFRSAPGFSCLQLKLLSDFVYSNNSGFLFTQRSAIVNLK